MKVLLTATVQSHIAQFHRPLVEVLHKHGCEVHVAARDNLVEKNGLKIDFVEKIYDVPFARSPKSLDNLKAYKQLKRIIDVENYDIIHCNTPMGGIVTKLAAFKARRLGTRVFYTAHGFHFYKGAPKKNWLLFYPIEKAFSRITDRIITINHEDYALAIKKFHTAISYIYGVGVDEQRYYPETAEKKKELRKEFGYSENQKIILCVGELVRNKNQTMAIDSVKKIIEKYPNTILLLAGNGPEREKLEHYVAKNGMNRNVQFLGYCTCLEKYQKIADILISCSKREGLPLNIVEAMLSANPVVVSRNRGHCELIQEGKTGYLVDVNDSEAMSKRIFELFENNKKGTEIGVQARKFAEQYSISNVKKELEKIYFPEIE